MTRHEINRKKQGRRDLFKETLNLKRDLVESSCDHNFVKNKSKKASEVFE